MRNRPDNAKAKTSSQIRCAIYTRKSTEEGLEQEFNSLDAQREAGEAYIASQKAEGWVCLPERYDDGGYTGGNMERPAVQRLMKDLEAGKIDCVMVYKVDRLSRSLMDFARMMEAFEKHKISFVSVTQQFNTTHSMGRLTLNILLSFAQFEREIISERTRDKIAAARRKGKWSGGHPILGYDVDPAQKLVVNPKEAERLRAIFDLYLEKQSLIQTAAELNARGWTTKRWTVRKGHERGGKPFDKVRLHKLLSNVAYLGKVRYKTEVHPGEHQAIIDQKVWERANRMLGANGRAGGMHVRNKHGALLKGLLHCGPCRHAMGHSYTVKNGKSCYRYYVCYKAQKQGWDACPSKSVPAEEIERFVVDRIRDVGKDPALVAAALEQAQAQAQERCKAVEAEQRALERDLRRLYAEIKRVATEAAGDRHAAPRLADLNERVRVAEGRLVELRQEAEEIDAGTVGEDDLEAALRAFDPVWETLSPWEQARVLGLLIERVDYDGKEGSVALTFRPSGIRTLGREATVEATG